MTYAAHKSPSEMTGSFFDGRDDTTVILGTFNSPTTPPIATADTLDEVRRQALAYLGTDPAASLYLTDSEGHVYDIVINAKHHEAISRAEGRLAIAFALLVFSCTCLLGAGTLGGWAPLLFLGTTFLYALVLWTRICNEVEGAVCFELLLIVSLIMWSVPHPAPSRQRSHRADAAPASSGETQFQSPKSDNVSESK